MKLQDILLFQTYRNIKNKLPDYVMESMKKLIPAYLVSSIFEIFGLVILFPVINVIINPSAIEKSFYLKSIYDTLRFENPMSFVLFLLSAITAIFILKNIILFFIYRMQTDIAFSLVNKIAFGKYMSYLNKPYQFHAENNTALLLRTIVQIPNDLITYSVLPFYNILNELFILTVIISGIAFYDPILFISLIFFCVPFLFIYDKFYRNKLKNISLHWNIAHKEIYKTGLQSLEGFREIVVFNKQDFFKSTFQRHLDLFNENAGKNYLLNIFSPKIVETGAVICIFCIFIFGYLFNKNLTSLAQFLIVFMIAAYRIIPSANKLILSFNYIKSSAHVFEYFEKSDFDFQKDETKESHTMTPLVFKKDVSIKNLSFKFPDHKENVLKNINICIPKSETIGIIGPSGSGKTTLLNILLRLYEEQEGGIYLDDIKIDKEKLAQWYKIVSYVPQNTILLDGTIKENIAFGIESKNVNEQLLHDVIEKSLLKTFVDGLPNGVQSQIGEKGIKISGGQRQRIGIARALYHGGEILIFDEATSSLDYETEKMLTESIDNISRKTDMTVIIVAHRIQTLQYCNNIYKLENGIINTKTTYSQLVKEKND